MSNKRSMKLDSESDRISKRVQQSKKEIEQLKAEYEKLLQRGIANTKVPEIKSTADINTESNCAEHKVPNTAKMKTKIQAIAVVNVTKKPEVSPRKTKTYDVSEARDFMKKQKEKRMEETRMKLKQSENVVETRKKKLLELQKKTSAILQRNNRNRSRSRSREPTVESISTPLQTVDVNLEIAAKVPIKKSRQVSAIKTTSNKLQVNPIKRKPSVSQIETVDEISVETLNQKSCTNPSIQSQLNNILQQNHNSAIKIQSCYRGYRQRKLFKTLLAAAKIKKEKQQKSVENKNKLLDIFEAQRHHTSYPHNFISVVKHQLNLAVSTPIKHTVDFGVQCSNTPENSQMTAKEIKEMLQKSIKKTEAASSKAMDKLVAEKVKSIQNLSAEVNILSSGHVYFGNKSTDFDLKNIDSLKLKSKKIDSTDSDTSNNIPNISTESIITHETETDCSNKPNTFIRSNLLKPSVCEISPNSTVNISHFLHSTSNLESAKKANVLSDETNFKIPQRMSRPTTKKPIILQDMQIRKGHTENDFKLELDADKIKNLNLVRRPKPPNLNNTMDIYNTKYSSKESPEMITTKSIKSVSNTKLSTYVTPEETVSIKTKSPSSDSLKKISLRSNNSSDDSSKKLLLSVPGLHEKSSSSGSVSSRRGSIIAYNRSDYSHKSNSSNQSSFEQPESSKSSNKNKSTEVRLKNSSSRDSIIAYNKSEYSRSNSSKSGGSHINSLTLNKNAPNPEQSLLASFRDYMSELKRDQKLSSGTGKSSDTEVLTSQGSFKTLRSDNGSNTVASVVPSLEYPIESLENNKDANKENEVSTTNKIVLKEGEKTFVESQGNANQIHVKFEAELHLLNDFNESLRQFMAVEKSLLDLRNRSDITTRQNQDTQTSIVIKTASDEHNADKSNSKKSPRASIISSLNYSRGSDFDMDKSVSTLKDISGLIGNKSLVYNNSNTNMVQSDMSVTTGFEISELPEVSMDITANNTYECSTIAINKENAGNVYAGLSLGMFEQLIKDEDARIENLKTILKIREKALLDRTKGELAWLEIQKKHFLETGKLHEASLVKKKQRGIIIKLQHEKHEMQRLKQMQKAASKERKTILKEQRNMIKAQLSTNNTITKIKRSSSRERRSTGPFKVYNYHRETLQSETSISRKNTVAEEIIYSSRESYVSRTENEGTDIESIQTEGSKVVRNIIRNNQTEIAKRSLLMREAALQKRRKAAEELLQWHQKLLEEEKKITELEMAASNIINHVPTVTIENSSCPEEHIIKGTQLNVLWKNISGQTENKFDDNNTYNLSQIALERICKDAKKSANRKEIQLDVSLRHSDSINSESNKESIKEIVESEYSIEFDNDEEKSESVKEDLEKGIKQSESTLNEIMQNISNITDEISELYKLSTKHEQSGQVLIPSLINTHGENTVQSQITLNDISSVNEVENGISIKNSIHSNVVSVPVTSIDNSKNNSGITNIESEFNQSSISDKKTISSENEEIKCGEIESVNSNNFRSTNIDIENSLNIELNSVDMHSIDFEKTSQNVATSNVNTENNIIENSNELSDNVELNSIGIESINEEKSNQNIASSNVDTESKLKNSNELPKNVELSVDFESIKFENVASSNVNTESNNLENSNELSKNVESHVDSESIKFENSNQNVASSNVNTESNNLENSNELSKNVKSNSVDIESIKFEKSNQNVASSNVNTESNNLKNSNELSNNVESNSVDVESINFEKSNQNVVSTEINNLENSNELSKIEELINSDKSAMDSINSDSTSEKHLSKSDSVDIDININISELSEKSSEKRSISNQNLTHLPSVHSEKESEFDDDSCKEAINSSLDEQIKSDIALSEVQTNIMPDVMHSKQSEIISENKEELSEHDVISKTQSHITAENNLEQSQQIISENEQDVSEKVPVDLVIEIQSSNSSIMDLVQNNVECDNKSILTSPIKSVEDVLDYIEDEEEKSTMHDISENLTDNKELQLTELRHDNEIIDTNLNEVENSINSISNKSISSDSNKNSINIETSDVNPISNSELHDEKESVVSFNSESQNETIDDKSIEEDNIYENENIPKSVSDDENNSEHIDEMENLPIIEVTIGEKHKSSELKLQLDSDCESSGSSAEIVDKQEEILDGAKTQVDVKERVSQILADANKNTSIGTKSPRMQDHYCITFYDELGSPDVSPEPGSPVESTSLLPQNRFYGNEAEELLRKQLAIEQEIKQLEQQQKEQQLKEQQQKEQLPYLYMREIPNKPPPPYKPPVPTSTPDGSAIVPASIDEIATLIPDITKTIYTSYTNDSLSTAIPPDELLDKPCDFMFDICKELATKHYGQFKEMSTVSWLKLNKKSAFKRPFNEKELNEYFFRKLKQIFGYEKVEVKESMIIKWSRKKRDKVDELLVVESQTEEADWTNYDQDELLVKNEVTNDILKMLLSETVDVFESILAKNVVKDVC